MGIRVPKWGSLVNEIHSTDSIYFSKIIMKCLDSSLEEKACSLNSLSKNSKIIVVVSLTYCSFFNSLTFKFNNFEFYNKIKFWRFHKQTEMLSVNLKRNRNLGDLSTRWVLNFICDTMVSLSFSLARLARSTIWI